jgi:hypothetical protein
MVSAYYFGMEDMKRTDQARFYVYQHGEAVQ